MTDSLTPVLSLEELRSFMAEAFPQVNMAGEHFHIDAISAGGCTMRLESDEAHLRPGGTISGPAMFTLADYAAYAVILAHIGPVGLAVTTNLNINFLRKPEPGTLLCEARIIKLGKRLCVVDAAITKPGNDDIIAHAIATYSIPPRS